MTDIIPSRKNPAGGGASVNYDLKALLKLTAKL